MNEITCKKLLIELKDSLKLKNNGVFQIIVLDFKNPLSLWYCENKFLVLLFHSEVWAWFLKKAYPYRASPLNVML